MKTSSEENPPELEVVNFGPVVRAKIDLRPLTVFIGPSNTGKSYLAILIYALHNYFNANERRNFFIDHKIPEKSISDIRKWAEEIFVNGKERKISGNTVLPPEILDLVCSGFSAQGGTLSNEIVRCFGIDEIKAIIRKKSRNGSRITLRTTPSYSSAGFETGLTIRNKETRLKMTVPEHVSLEISTGKKDYLTDNLHFSTIDMLSGRDKDGDFFTRRFLNSLAYFLLPDIVGPMHLPAFYLPADRTGVMHAHSTVVSTLIRSAAMAGVRPDTRTPVLSGVLADFLEQLIQFASSRGNRPHPYLGKAIEESILEGAVHIDKSEAADYPLFRYRPKGWNNDLNLMNASSMVSELAPVVLYLRYRVRSNNVLIVEEPESHLHPAMQVEFIRQLAALVHSGIRVIVTTHSEWLLGELANLVQLSKLPETRRKGITGSDLALSPEQVGAWLFQTKNKPRGSVVKEVKLNDSGLYESGFDDVSDALYNKWADIQGGLKKTDAGNSRRGSQGNFQRMSC